MATPAVINLEKLTQPIPGDSPAGPDLRLDFSAGSIYQQIRDGRTHSTNVEREIQKGNAEYSTDQLAWNKVQDQATKAIVEMSKDLRLTVWLCEALIRQKGFAGLRDGLKAIRLLSETFWNDLHPRPEVEEGDPPPTEVNKVETRVQPVEGLFAGVLSYPIYNTAITEVPKYTFSDYRGALALEKITDKVARQTKINEGTFQLSDFNEAFGTTTPDFYKTLYEDLKQATEELALLSKSLDERCPKDERGFSVAPSIGDTEKVLKECQEIVKELGKKKGLFMEPAAGTDVALPGQDGAVAGGEQKNGKGAIVTRDDALAALLHIADFFRRTEPHSPLAHHVEEAVRWGRMDLAQLLSELITDDKMRQAVFTRIGIEEVAEAKKK